MKEKMATTRKSRKKAAKVHVEHAVYGPGEVEEARLTDTGKVLLVHFPDGSTRTLLALPQFWLSLPSNLAAIPVTQTALVAEPNDAEPDIEYAEVDGDVEPELAA
jgi:hypothetical protein